MNYDAYLRKKLELNPDLNRECCRDVNNLRYAFDENKFKDALVLKCKHCGKLHHRRLFNPGSFFGTGAFKVCLN